MLISLLLFFLLILLFFILICFLVFLFFHVITIFTGAPYLGINKDRLYQIISISDVKKGEKTVDLGSGDGRIVIAMAKKGAMAYGYELNPFLVLLSWWNIYKSGMQGRAFVYWKNFWYIELSSFDIITIYGISYIMKKLETKIQKRSKEKSAYYLQLVFI